MWAEWQKASSTSPLLPPISATDNSHRLDDLLLEIQETMKHTSNSPSAANPNQTSLLATASASHIPFPATNTTPPSGSRLPPPLPPKHSQPHALRHKISLPSLPSGSSHFANLAASSTPRLPPPVPRLPEGYNYSSDPPHLDLIRPHHPTQSASPYHASNKTYNPHPTANHRPAAAMTESPQSHTSPPQPYQQSSVATSPYNVFRRSVSSSRASPPQLAQSSSDHSQSQSSSQQRRWNSPPAPNHPLQQDSSSSSASSSAANTYPAPPRRPLPHLPSTQHPSNSHLTVSLPTPNVNEYHHSTHSSHSTHRTPSTYGSGVSYTNMLHDYDMPLGAHSIPTRISTRPINFTSPDHVTNRQHHFSSDLDDRAPFSSSPAMNMGDADNLMPINPADRDMMLNGPGLISGDEPSGRRSGDNQSHGPPPLHIYTTRPSFESMSESTSARPPQRSNSVAGLRTGQQGRSGLSASLSVERGSTRFHSSIPERHPAGTGVRGEHTSSKMSQLVIEPDFNLAYLSHVARFLKRNVPKGTKIKGNIEYPMSFTGREAVTTITHCLNRVNPSTRSTTQATLNRKLALSLCRVLLAEQFFHEVTNLNHEIFLNDNIDEVYVFPDDIRQSGTSVGSKFGLEEQLFDIVEDGIGSGNLPQGILTNLTKCYSFSCRMMNSRRPGDLDRSSGCYSYSCPNRKRRDSVLHRVASAASPIPNSEASSAQAVVQTKDWASVVSKELLASLDPKEIARQSIIYEVISGEQEYVQDLDDYETLFITPLKQSNPPILTPQRMSEVIEKVVSNVLEVRDHNRVLLQNLLIRQQDQHPLVKGIGDIVLNSALDWGSDYIRYTSDHVFGEVEVNEEKTRNPAFAELLNKIPKQSSRRADFKHYYSRAFVRLQRYILLLESLLRKTPDGHEDRTSIESAMDVIRRQCREADQAVCMQQAKLQLVKLHNEIVVKPDTPDLQLLSPNRQLILAGKMIRKPEGSTGLSEWNEQHVMLFDHYFVMTKVKRIDDDTTRYHLSRPPIMLELIRVTGFNEPCERKSRGLRTITGTLGSNGGLERGNSDPYSSPSSTAAQASALGSATQDDRSLFPITIHSLGRNTYQVTMYVESERARQLWKAKFEEAIGVRMQILDNYKVFELYPMTDQTFAASGSVPSAQNGGHTNGAASAGASGGAANGAGALTSSQNGGSTVAEPLTNMHGPPTCSVPFRSSDGKRLVAIGCMNGLWIGLRNDPSSMRQVIHIKSITQCAVLQEYGFLLVLAEKILLAYPLESLVPSRAGQALMTQSSMGIKAPVRAIASRLSGHKDVLFFRCGKVGTRTLVIYVKKGGVNQTVFKALEPVRNVDKNKTTATRGFFGLGGSKSDSFRGYKEFFVPSESYAIQYLRSTLAIHCARGFEIMNLDTLKTASIPDFNQIKQQDSRLAALQRRCDESRPLGMFRLGENEFLLCYDEFAFFADKHGDPLVDRYGAMMEWDGKPSAVAYSSPYVICFSSMMIEVWNTLSSKRVQIMVGQMISCTYDGGSLGDDGSHVQVIRMNQAAGAGEPQGWRPEEEEDEGERRVHVMMKDVDQFYRVFELVPLTIHH